MCNGRSPHGSTSWTPNIADLIKPLEETIRKVFLPNLTGQNAFNDMEKDMLALPARLGGLGILDPCRTSALHYSTCETISAPLVRLILDQSETYAPEIKEAQARMRNNAQKFHRQYEARTANDLKETYEPSCRRPSLFALRKEPQVGSQLYPSPNMGLPYIKGPSRMPCACGTFGDHHIYPPTASVASILPSNMHLAAQGADFLLFVTMRFETSLQTC